MICNWGSSTTYRCLFNCVACSGAVAGRGISWIGSCRGDDGGRGDRYHAFYTGLNYQLRGHKLKLMAGTEWATMDGGGDGGSYNGWTWLAGVRLYF